MFFLSQLLELLIYWVTELLLTFLNWHQNMEILYKHSFCLFFLFLCVSPKVLELTLWTREALKSELCPLCLWSTAIRGMCHHATVPSFTWFYQKSCTLSTFSTNLNLHFPLHIYGIHVLYLMFNKYKMYIIHIWE